jgi:hypothetical protein
MKVEMPLNEVILDFLESRNRSRAADITRDQLLCAGSIETSRTSCNRKAIGKRVIARETVNL